MNKLMTLAIMTLLSLSVYAQKVTGVAGVRFGEGYTSVTECLKARFGLPSQIKSNEVEYYDIAVGGTNYQYASFVFRYGKLVSATFYNHYNTFEDAKRCREGIASLYREKYQESTIIDDDGGKCYRYGDIEDGYYPIVVETFKANSKGGENYYYTKVTYFGYKMNDMYKDDI